MAVCLGQLHLFGYEFPSTIMLMVPNHLYLLASSKKGMTHPLGRNNTTAMPDVFILLCVRLLRPPPAAIFSSMVSAMKACPVTVHVIVANKKDGYVGNFQKLVSVVKAKAANASVRRRLLSLWLSFVLGSFLCVCLALALV